MTAFFLTPAARDDMSEVWRYSTETWGSDQAASYVRSIQHACQGLADGTRIGHPVDIRNGYRKTLVGSHVLYFTHAQGQSVIVVRILHQSMDVSCHL